MLSWIVNFVLAVIIIKFIVYPGLGLLLGTSYPIVAVVSESMEHDGNFDEWWQSKAICDSTLCSQQQFYNKKNITKKMFEKFDFKNGFNKGDVIILHGKKPKDIEIGEVIVFQAQREYPIIHRVVDKWEKQSKYYFTTKGDHNERSITNNVIAEHKIIEDRVIGVGTIRIPYLGWVKLGFTYIINILISPFVSSV